MMKIRPKSFILLQGYLLISSFVFVLSVETSKQQVDNKDSPTKPNGPKDSVDSSSQQDNSHDQFPVYTGDSHEEESDTDESQNFEDEDLSSANIPRNEEDSWSQHEEKLPSGKDINMQAATPDPENPIKLTDDTIESSAQPELTEDEIKANQFYEDGMKILNKTGRSRNGMKHAYKYLYDAAELNHTNAMEMVALASLLGNGMSQSTTRAYHYFVQLAALGNPRGQMGLAFLYTTGLRVNSSQALALVYFTFAALGGDHFAQMALGYRYWAGIGVEANCETALTYYKRVASQVASVVSATGGAAIHRIRLVEEMEQGNTQAPNTLLDDDLLQYYQFLAEKGDINAQVGLGQLYYQGGRGVEVNYERALHYFRLAEQAGNPNALAFLGKMFAEGSDVLPANNETALHYFHLAAEAGNPVGLSGLGNMYLHGRGVEVDFGKAREYFAKAADQGWGDGQLQLGVMYYRGLGVKANSKLALKYFNLASQQGHVLAFYNLAQMHATGTGVLRSCHTATELFKNVAERGRWGEMLMEAHSAYKSGRHHEALMKYLFLGELGYEVAQTNSAFILDQGISDLTDKSETFKRALLQWKRAASQGYTNARVKVGDYHYYGLGTKVDYSMAAQHYRLASEQQRNPQAMFNLGYMHEQGLGMTRDIHLAKRFYDLAAEASADAQVPVSLALAKLSIYFFADSFKDWGKMWNTASALDWRWHLTTKWDFYLIPLLTGLAGIILVLLQRGRERR